MTREEAISVLEESKRQNEVMRDNPNTFFKVSDIVTGKKNAQKRIDALNMAISAIRQQDVPDTNVGKNEPLKEFAEDVARQFAYHIKTIDGHTAYSTGGLSTLETAFDILGWDEPHPCPECECEADGCHEWATCGTPTKDGYKRLCGKHFRAVQEEDDHA